MNGTDWKAAALLCAWVFPAVFCLYHSLPGSLIFIIDELLFPIRAHWVFCHCHCRNRNHSASDRACWRWNNQPNLTQIEHKIRENNINFEFPRSNDEPAISIFILSFFIISNTVRTVLLCGGGCSSLGRSGVSWSMCLCRTWCIYPRPHHSFTHYLNSVLVPSSILLPIHEICEKHSIIGNK